MENPVKTVGIRSAKFTKNGGFQSHGGTPKTLVGLFHGKSLFKNGSVGGYPYDLGNHQMLSFLHGHPIPLLGAPTVSICCGIGGCSQMRILWWCSPVKYLQDLVMLMIISIYQYVCIYIYVYSVCVCIDLFVCCLSVYLHANMWTENRDNPRELFSRPLKTPPRPGFAAARTSQRSLPARIRRRPGALPTASHSWRQRVGECWWELKFE